MLSVAFYHWVFWQNVFCWRGCNVTSNWTKHLALYPNSDSGIRLLTSVPVGFSIWFPTRTSHYLMWWVSLVHYIYNLTIWDAYTESRSCLISCSTKIERTNACVFTLVSHLPSYSECKPHRQSLVADILQHIAIECWCLTTDVLISSLIQLEYFLSTPEMRIIPWLQRSIAALRHFRQVFRDTEFRCFVAQVDKLQSFLSLSLV